ncbi:MAG: 50S ribosomal protein L19 [Candidatus Moranbacteria bacterium]|nr:50S ribosomal protein L19 [Candidatus Moranbacteria bacterium]
MVQIKQKIKAGDLVRVKKRVTEGEKQRIQVIEGTVIAHKHGNEPGATITVRKNASGVGVEFIFPIHSPLIQEIKILKRTKVRRAKLYFLRQRGGKAARLKDSESQKQQKNVVVKKQTREKKPTQDQTKTQAAADQQQTPKE